MSCWQQAWLHFLPGGAFAAHPGWAGAPVPAVRRLQMLRRGLLTSQVLVEWRDGAMLYGCIWNGVGGVDSAPLIPLACSLVPPNHRHRGQAGGAPPGAVSRARPEL